MKLRSCAVLILSVLLLAVQGEASLWYDSFQSTESVTEVGDIDDSADPTWWVSSGGRLRRNGRVARTLQNELPEGDPLRAAYARSNPVDTDDGSHPQNVFRLVNRGLYRDFEQQVFFRIRKTQESSSPNRNASNGVLFFNRYQDSQTLYYAGLRVDGAAVVKKKVAGVYTTLAYRQIYPGSYDRGSSPNLLPVGRWIGLRTTIESLETGGVLIVVSVRDNRLGAGWTPVLEAVDSGRGPSGPAIETEGHSGIRTDFMDVAFDGYSAVPTGSSGCASVTPLEAPLSGSGELATLLVEAAPDCTWSAAGDVRWLNVVDVTSVVGTGLVTISVPARAPGVPSRTGTVRIGDLIVPITQAGNAPL